MKHATAGPLGFWNGAYDGNKNEIKRGICAKIKVEMRILIFWAEINYEITSGTVTRRELLAAKEW